MLATSPPKFGPIAADGQLTEQQQTLLNENVAKTISRVSTATRFSLRCVALVCEAFFEAAKFSTAASLAIGRQALVTALQTARSNNRQGRIGSRGDFASLNARLANEPPSSFQAILDEYTALGIYFVHHTFSLAELFTLTTFHLTSSTIKFSLTASEETVRVIDGLFGSTETSRALAAIVEIVKREMAATDGHADADDLGPFGAFSTASKVAILGGVTKSVVAYACLQKLTARRRLAGLPVETTFEFLVDYDRIRAADDMDLALDADNHAADDDAGLGGGEPGLGPIWESDDEREIVTEMEGMLDRFQLLDSDSDGVDEAAEAMAESAATIVDEDGEDVRTITTITEIPREESDEPLLRHQTSIQSLMSSVASRAKAAVMPARGGSSNGSGMVSSSSGMHDAAGTMVVPRLRPNPNHTRRTVFSSGATPQLALPAPTVPQPTHVYPREPLVTNLSRYLQYSTGAYGKRFMRIFGIGRGPIQSVIGDVHHPNHHAFAAHVGIPVHDIILSSFQPPRPGYLSAAEEEGNKARTSWFNAESVLSLEAPKIHPLVHYLCIDHRTNSIVLTLRGTLGLSDVLTDLTCDYADLSVHVPTSTSATTDSAPGSPTSATAPPSLPPKNGATRTSTKEKRVFKAHAGMLKSAELLANSLGPFIKHALDSNPGYGLVLSGHSLGGGVAALLALLWSDRFNDDDTDDSGAPCVRNAAVTDGDNAFLDAQMHRTAASSGLPMGRPLHAFTYGCPCIVSHELSVLCGSLVTTVVHGADVVTCLSLGMLQDFKVMTRTLTDSRNRGVAEKIITKALGLDRAGMPGSADASNGAASASVPSTAADVDDDDSPGPNGPAAASTEEDWLWSLMQTLRAEMVAEKLYPPGTIYWLRTRPYTKRTTHVAPSSAAATGPASLFPGVPALMWPFASPAPPPAGASAAAAGVAAGRATVTHEDRRCLVVLDRVEDVQDLVGELRFSRSLFTDHNPRFYEDGIRALELGVAGMTVSP
ncbi:hypothetical protein BC828DRAFT_405010 [Blastocladiella britannica]|nr:hypothetical protein BC828DRAFT_405010 [Blastocladiella britannica]